MSRAFHSMRGYVHPRAHFSGSHKNLHASNVILGMLGVMLAVLAIAHAITVASSVF